MEPHGMSKGVLVLIEDPTSVWLLKSNGTYVALGLVEAFPSLCSGVPTRRRIF